MNIGGNGNFQMISEIFRYISWSFFNASQTFGFAQGDIRMNDA